MSEHYRATLFDPSDLAQQRAATLMISNDHLLVSAAGCGQYEVLISTLTFVRGGYNDMALLVTGTDASGREITVQVDDDQALLARLSVVGPVELAGRIQPMIQAGDDVRRYWQKTAALTVAMIVLVCLGLGWAGRLAVGALPPESEEGFGKAAIDGIIEHRPLLETGPVRQAVDAVWQRVAKGLPPNPYRFRLYVVDAPTVNALAAPGGHVVVFTGLLAKLDGPEALAGILAHEAGHVIRRHGMQGIVKHVGIGVAIAFLFGDSGGLMGVFASLGKSLATGVYDREQEREADADAVAALGRARIDAAGMIGFFDELAKAEPGLVRVLAIAASHPPSAERSAALRSLVQKAGNSAPSPIAVDWARVKAAIK